MVPSRLARSLLAGVSLSSLMVVAPVTAQDSNNTLSLEEITVTAQKREQSAQDVPIALNAFSGDFLDVVAADDLRDIVAYTPGLEIGGVTQARYEVRGVETSDFGVGTDPAVGVYVDGIYAARSGAAIIQFADIERVEVLKGPQGTLFGRNTAAGAISVITKKPNIEEFEGEVKLRYGRFDHRLLNAMLNFPMTDTMAFRVNLLTNERDGYQPDALTGEKYGRLNNDTGRLQFRWEPSEKTSFNLAYEFDRTNQDEQPPKLSVSNGQWQFGTKGDETLLDSVQGQVLLGLAPALGLPLTPDTPASALNGFLPLSSFYAALAPFGYSPANPNASWRFFQDVNSAGGADPFGPTDSDIGNGQERRDLDGLNLTITHDFDWATLTSISSYKKFTTNNLEDNDSSADPFAYFTTDNTERNQSFYQEVRLNGQTDRLTWTLGGSYYWEKAEQTTYVDLSTDSVARMLYNLGATTGGALAGGFDPLDGINACEAIALDTMGGFYNFYDMPLDCLGVPTGGLGLENLANLIGTTMGGRIYQESMGQGGKFKALAFYADATYKVTDRLNLTGGIRWTQDKKSWTWLNGPATIEGRSELDVPGVGNLADIFTGQIMPSFVGGTGDIVYNLADLEAVIRAGNIGCENYTDLGSNSLEGTAFTCSDTWTNISPRVVVDYVVSDDLMVYASYALGYKAGGYNTQEVGSYFDNEDVWNFEAGLKSEWFDRTLRFNLSVWKYKYEDKQSIRLENVPGSELKRYTTRTEDASGKGVDVEILWAPVDGLRLFANAGYQDVTCTRNCGTDEDQPDNPDPFQGQPTGVPSKRVSVGGDYRFDLGNSGSLLFHIDHSYSSARRDNGRCQVEGTCGLQVVGDVMWYTGGAKNYTNARIGWENESGAYGLSVFGRNIFSNIYPGGAAGDGKDLLGAASSSIDEPWTWGIELKAKF
ncbi:hypothetical protein GCM10017044_06980 [Kordiimonas sediminis]|uniref:TonB-dependent receptor n=1 Tax=Kordiimonas sediminis TaxID=1735581 RepID=A0A919ALB5_9PROT|nr:TonB-dependent receptor [Kordiimonas sediminis]GHF15432.1 hypothetical protein GCM10017044_06980 [Kordiimonas sediminis]